MKNVNQFIMLSVFLISAANADGGGSVLDTVNERMRTYNNHDLVNFLKTYSEDIQVYDYPNMPIGKQGKRHIKSIFEPLFANTDIQVKIHHQIVQGKYVVNNETVTVGGKKTKYVSIYEVENGLIKTVQFIRE